MNHVINRPVKLECLHPNQSLYEITLIKVENCMPIFNYTFPKTLVSGTRDRTGSAFFFGCHVGLLNGGNVKGHVVHIT
jgi:hypothetical protein